MALTAGEGSLKPFGSLEQRLAKSRWAIFPRKRLDVSFSDLWFGISQSLRAPDTQRAEIIERIERFWSGRHRGSPDAMVALSVRTAFDLLLQALRLPPGSEVIMSAVTIKDMVAIVEHHGLVPVPCELDGGSLGPSVEPLQRCISPKSKMIVFAHIFGTLNNLDGISKVAKEHGLLLVEDCAECYKGASYRGSPVADISLFSFGTIKTATAFGGSIARVADEKILKRMRELNAAYPVRPRTQFMQRLVKYSALHSMSSPALYGIFVRGCRTLGKDHDELITSMIRGFAGEDFFRLIRQQPSTPLVALLWRRLTTFDSVYFDQRRQKCQKVEELLKDVRTVQIPGKGAQYHAYWLFPVIVANPKSVCHHMLREGFDVTQGTTQLGSVHRYAKSEHVKENAQSTEMMGSIVYLPVTPELPDWALEKMIDALRDATRGQPIRQSGRPTHPARL